IARDMLASTCPRAFSRQTEEGGRFGLSFVQMQRNSCGPVFESSCAWTFSFTSSTRANTMPSLGTCRSEEHTSELQSRVDLVCRHRYLLVFPTRRSSDLDCPRYVGLDLSESVLQANRRRRPLWSFIRADAAQFLRARFRIVLCMDVLFHVLDESQYNAILRNLSVYADGWLFVGTWNRNPLSYG